MLTNIEFIKIIIDVNIWANEMMIKIASPISFTRFQWYLRIMQSDDTLTV